MKSEEKSKSDPGILPVNRAFLGVRQDLARDLTRRPWLCVKDCAAVLELSEKTVYRRIKLASRRRPHPAAIPTAPGFSRHRIPTAFLLRALAAQAEGRAGK